LFAFMVAVPALGHAPGGDAPTPEADAAEAQRIEFERLRAEVEAALALLDAIPEDRRGDATLGMEVRDRLVALGPAVIPFLEAEVFGPEPPRASFAIYTLGKFATPESEIVLKRAVERFDGDDGIVAMRMAQAAIIALASQGRPDTLQLLAGLDSDIARMGHFEGWSTLVATAALLGPSARPTLLDWLEPLSKASDDRSHFRLVETLQALARLPDAASLDRIVPSLTHSSWRVRRAAVAAAGAIGSPAAVDLLLARVRDEDEDPRVRGDAAIEIERLEPSDRLDDILALLETLEPAAPRGFLYRTVARIGGDRAVPALRSHRGREDRADRFALVSAAGRTGDGRALPLIREGIADPDASVALRATQAIAEIPSAGAVETLLATLNDPRWIVRSSAIDGLVAREERRAGPRIADRLVRDELSQATTRPETRGVVRTYGEALVSLRDAAAVDDIRGKIDRQGDPELKAYLRGLVTRLDAVRDLGSDVAAWAARASDRDADMRRLAAERLVEIGSPEALEALTNVLDAGDRDLRLAIVRHAARRASPGSAPLLEHVLLDPAFDIRNGPALRTWAAWGAQRIGTAAMADLLERASDRRHGLDAGVLVGLAVLRGPSAAERIERYRRDRLIEFDFLRGAEQDALDRIGRAVRAGRDLGRYAEEPDPEGRVH